MEQGLLMRQSQLTVKTPGSIHIKNVGSMDNAKRHAKKLANELELKPTEHNWTTKKTYYAENSGLYGNWESSAHRTYTTPEGTKTTIKIHVA